jgi:1,5-anhydro-D-fructose reductase (1,5-anhydro-D-mannitol-forming)
VMTQEPVGEIELVTSGGGVAVPFSGHDLYVQGVREFCAAVAGAGVPAATGWDGVKSLAVALAVRQAAQSGARVEVSYGSAS